MAKRSDMGKPVTREELEDVIAKVATKEDLKAFATKEDVKLALSNYPTKEDLKLALSNYPTKEDLKLALSNHPTKDELRRGLDAWGHALIDYIDKSTNRLSAELAGHVKAANEAMRDQIKAVDDKYADLPDRVTRLEEHGKR